MGEDNKWDKRKKKRREKKRLTTTNERASQRRLGIIQFGNITSLPVGVKFICIMTKLGGEGRGGGCPPHTYTSYHVPAEIMSRYLVPGSISRSDTSVYEPRYNRFVSAVARCHPVRVVVRNPRSGHDCCLGQPAAWEHAR